MIYKNELNKYKKRFHSKINNTSKLFHRMKYTDEIVETYKNAPYEEFCLISSEEDMIQEIDYENYLKFLMRLK